MSIIRKFFGLSLACFADVAMGIFLSHLFVKFAGCEKSIFFYFFGAFCAIAPDFDIILQKIGLGEVYSDHRQIPHYPILMIALAFVFLSGHYAVLAVACLLSHYIHDSLAIPENGGGVKWLMPFCRNEYQFTILRGVRRLTLEEIEKLKEKNGTLEEWLEMFYLRPTPSSVGAVLLFAASCLAVGLW